MITISVAPGSIFRYYETVCNNTVYKINHIRIYSEKENKVICRSNSGWLEDINSRDIKSFDLDTDKISMRRKEKFDGSVFLVSLGKEPYDTHISAILYIPDNLLNIKFVGNRLMYCNQLRAVYSGDNNIQISEYIESVDQKLHTISLEISQISKSLNLEYNIKDKTLEELDEDMKKLTSLIHEYKTEQARIESLSDKDFN